MEAILLSSSLDEGVKTPENQASQAQSSYKLRPLYLNRDERRRRAISARNTECIFV